MSVADIQTGPSIRPDQIDEYPPVPFWPTMWSLMGHQHRRLLIAILTSTLTGVAVALQPLVIKWIVDDGILREGARNEKITWSLGFVGLFLFLSAFRMSVFSLGYFHMVKAIQEMLCRLRGRFFRHVQGLCFRFHDQVSSGELFNYIMGSPVQAIQQFMQQFCLFVPYQLVSWVVAVGVLLAFNWMMTVITLAVVVVIALVNQRSRGVIREISADFMQTESQASKYVADMLRGTRAVKLYAMEDRVGSAFEQQVEQMRSKGVRLAFRSHLEHMKPEGINYIGMALIYGVGAWFCVFGDMKPGTFLAFASAFGTLMGPLMMMFQLNLIRGNAEAGLDRIMRILHVEKTTTELPPECRASVPGQAEQARHEHQPCVEIRNLRFAYDDNRPVFADLSVTIPDGQSVALVGPSGSGKSTFVSLLLRLYDRQGGEILLNGRDLCEYSLHELRSSFGVVPQDPFIFQASLWDNVRITRPDASDEEIRQAMEMACVTEFAERMPDGLHSWLGEGGANLSGGQRQRVAIARALLARPRYFIFDEATSSLDTQSERRIQRAMNEIMQGYTTFVIAHRLSTVRNVHRILVFDNGQVVQDGSYAELSEQPGLFQSMLRAAEEAEGTLY